MKRKIFLLMFIGFFLLIGVLVLAKNNNLQENNLISTLTPSPTNEAQNPNWKTFMDTTQHVSFAYPQILSTKYINTQEWPPKIIVTTRRFTCNEQILNTNGLPRKTIQKKIGNSDYCIVSTTEGAAGTIYTNYIYSFFKDNKLIGLSFTLAYSQCGNFSDPQKTECENERRTFDIDKLLDKIAQSVKL